MHVNELADYLVRPERATGAAGNALLYCTVRIGNGGPSKVITVCISITIIIVVS